MTTIDVTELAPDPQKVQAVFGKILEEFAATGGVQLMLLGIRTGMFQAMAGAGPLLPAELATRVGTAEPYAAEWLKAQAAGGYVDYDPATQTFTLPVEVAAVLADDAQSQLVAGFSQALMAMAADLGRFEERFRNGEGFGWHEHSPEHWDGMDQMTRALVCSVLVPAWFPAIDGLVATLEAGGRVADIGCGYGAPLVAMAQAFPASRFFGFDYHDTSISRAREAAEQAGVTDRVRFDVASAKDFPGDGYDLLTFFDSFHDLGDPVGALRHARRALTPDGAVLLVEPAGGDAVEDNLNPLGRLWYAASTMVCTANALSQEGHPLGTIAGEARLRAVASEAGFTRISRVPADAPFNILLELRP